MDKHISQEEIDEAFTENLFEDIIKRQQEKEARENTVAAIEQHLNDLSYVTDQILSFSSSKMQNEIEKWGLENATNLLNAIFTRLKSYVEKLKEEES